MSSNIVVDWALQCLEQALRTDAPVLPMLWLTQGALRLGWGVVLAWLVVCLLGKYWRLAVLERKSKIILAMLAMVLACLPGAFSPVYWLGLAFQTPSVVTIALCGVLLRRSLIETPASDAEMRSSRNSLLALALLGVLWGWVLLLDTFALLPVQVYALGFSTAAVALVFLMTLMPWALSVRGPLDPVAWVAPAAVVCFVVCRLPTGNVWDAVLDPWLWVALQVHLVRKIPRRRKKADA